MLTLYLDKENQPTLKSGRNAPPKLSTLSVYDETDRETVPFLHLGSVIMQGRESGLLLWSEWQWHIYVNEPY